MGRLYSVCGPSGGSEARSFQYRRIDVDQAISNVVFTAAQIGGPQVPYRETVVVSII